MKCFTGKQSTTVQYSRVFHAFGGSSRHFICNFIYPWYGLHGGTQEHGKSINILLVMFPVAYTTPKADSTILQTIALLGHAVGDGVGDGGNGVGDGVGRQQLLSSISTTIS